MTTDDEIERLLKNLTPDDLKLVPPPTSVWDAIEAEIGEDDAAARHPTRRPPWLLAAAAITAVISATLIVTLVRERDSTSDSQVAEAELTFDPNTFDPLGAGSSAHAAVNDNTLIISEESLPTDIGDAKLELWLLKIDGDTVVDLVSLGPVAPTGTQLFTIPAGVDPNEYRVVDISIEPPDNDPAHSGRSILRGELSV